MLYCSIRLRRRQHTTRLPFYNLVVMVRSKRPRGFFFSNLGYVHYFGDKKIIALDIQKISSWLLINPKVNHKAKKFLAMLNFVAD